ncbi:30S ribosomal protein S17 [Candidatus Saccharibacteria bacterium]|nr:30S ribosomal protein S17 [Candidatus Saccharibacteria bacterium]
MARTLIGTVMSDKVDKTIVIAVHTRKTHPIYKKKYSVTTRFMAHDEKNEANVGDKVQIIECRPLSRRKRFTLERVIENARITHVEPEASATEEEPASEETKPKHTASKKESK